MIAPTADATMEREIEELYDALVALAPRWDWARVHPEAAADSLNLGGRVRWAFLATLSGEEARAPAEPASHHLFFWKG